MMKQENVSDAALPATELRKEEVRLQISENLAETRRLMKEKEERLIASASARRFVNCGFSGLEARAEEKKRRENAGVTQRIYEWHKPANDHWGGCDDRARQRHRDRQRTYRGKDAETVRTYEDLSDLTPEEIAAWKRAQATERKRLERQRKKAAALEPAP